MNLNIQRVEPKFKKESDPKIGLLTLTTDLTIEKDFEVLEFPSKK